MIETDLLKAICNDFNEFFLELSKTTKTDYNLNEVTFSIKEIFHNNNYLFLKVRQSIDIPKIFQEEYNMMIQKEKYSEVCIDLMNMIRIIEYIKYNI